MAALDAYLAAAPLGALLTYAGLGLLAVVLGPFAAASVVEHVAVVRGGR